MKIFLFTLSLLLLSAASFAQGVSISTDNSTADPSAALEVKSTTAGMLVPRMTTAQRTAIASPATGLLVFDTDLGAFYFYDGTSWTALSNGTETDPKVASSGNNMVPRWDGAVLTDGIIYDNGTNVGIGVTSPDARLAISTLDTLLDETLDQSQTSGSATTGSTGPRWQSFTAGISGSLTQIEILFASGSSTSTRTVTLYEGEGTTGAVLGSSTLTNQPDAWVSCTFSDVEITAGTTYTIHMDNGSYWKTDLSDPYAGGRANGSATSDNTFKTYVAQYVGLVYNFTEKGLTIGDPSIIPAYELEVDGTVKASSLLLPDGATDGALLQSDASGNATWVSTTTLLREDTLTSTNTTSETITNFNNLSSAITISAAEGQFTTSTYLNVGVNIATTGYCYYYLKLQSPSGTEIILDVSQPDYTNTFFSTTATATIAASGTASPYSGTFLPFTGYSFADFNGDDLNGTWTLVLEYITGGNGSTTITLQDWSLSLSSPSPFGDDMGNHTAEQNISMNSLWISNDGDNEGIRIDNSGNVGIGTSAPGNKLEVQSSSSVAINAQSTGNNAYLQSTAPGGLEAALALKTYTGSTASTRWLLGKGNGSESGSNAGSDLFVNRYDDTGAYSGQPLAINRSNGTITLGSNGVNSSVNTVQVNGSMAIKTEAITSSGSYTLDGDDYCIVFGSGATGNSITLPAASTCAGRMYLIVNHSTQSISISSYTTAASTTSTSIAAGTTLQLISSGSDWHRIN